MFTGIIKAKTRAKEILDKQSEMVITFPIPKGWKIEMGESINIDGVCSTVMDLKKDYFRVFYMAETLDKTNLKQVTMNHYFNLERSLTAADLMGGHFVSGHVDTIGEVLEIQNKGLSRVVTFKIPKKFSKYLIYKGSVTVNGVSLTVVKTNPTSFVVSLIPHTLENTNLGELRVRDQVNIEVDMLAKYIEKLLQREGPD